MIKSVGDTQIQEKYLALCHCGSAKLELSLPNGIEKPRPCDCSNCGIYTHHQRRSSPNEYGFNIGCLEGVNPFELGDVVTNDGVNHPADRSAS
jgi:hypothetical protein